jgi:hypothetical protein
LSTNCGSTRALHITRMGACWARSAGARPGQIGGTIGAPVAQKANDDRFEPFVIFSRPLYRFFQTHAGLHVPQHALDLRITCSSVKCAPVMACAGQAATHAPQPWHKAVITSDTLRSSWKTMAL